MSSKLVKIMVTKENILVGQQVEQLLDPFASNDPQSVDRLSVVFKREIGERIFRLKALFGISTEELALLLNTNTNNLYNYKQGKAEPPSHIYEKFTEIGINGEWIRTGLGSMFSENEAGKKLMGGHNEAMRFTSKNVGVVQELARQLKESEEKRTLIDENQKREYRLSKEIAYIKDMFRAPLARTQFSAEVALIARAGVPSTVFELPNTNTTNSLFFIGISGNSMTGLDIHEGDILMMQRQSTFKDKDIILARLGDDLTIKEIRNGNGYLLLNPANSSFEPIKITPELDFECMGVYTRFKRREE